MAFIDQVQDLTSLTVSDNDELSRFLQNGVIDVTSRWLAMRPQDSHMFMRISSESTSQAGISASSAKVISVLRESGTNDNWRNCRRIPPDLQSMVADVDSLHYASKFNPAYLISEEGAVLVYPEPSSGGANSYKVYYVNGEAKDQTNDATLIHSHSDVKYFPEDKVYLVVIYAGMRLIHATLAAKSAPSVPVSQPLPTLNITATDPTAITLTTVNYSAVTASTSTALTSFTAPTYVKPIRTVQSAFSGYTSGLSQTDPGIFSLNAATPAVPAISSQAISDPSSFAPAYTKPTLTLGTAPTISNLSISSVAPVAPSAPSFTTPAIGTITVASTAITNLGVAPTYSKPSITTRTAFKAFYADTSGANPFGDNDPGALQITAVSPLVPSLTSITFSSVDTDIDAFLPTYSTATISAGGVYGANTPPSFTKPAVAPDFAQVNTYIDTDEDIELASVKLQEISAQLSEYSTNIQNEQMEFNKENIAYQANIQEAMQELQVANQVKLAEAQGGLQLAISNEDRSQQRVFQNAINDMKVIFDNNSQAITKYQAEASTYQAIVSKEVQEYQQKLSRYTTELNTVYTSWAKTESDLLQQYTTDIQNELNEYNKENVSYQAKLQEAIQQAQINAQKAQAQAQIDATDAQQEASLLLQQENQEYAASLQKFGAEVQQYQANVASEVQGYTQKMSRYQLELNTVFQAWQKTETDNLAKYQADIQNELNSFNDSNIEYQAQLQISIQNAQLDSQDDAQKIQKYSSELQSYQNDINKQVQEFTNNFQKNLQVFQQENQVKLTEYQADIGSALNGFNKDNVVYQADLQHKLQQAQIDMGDAQKEADLTLQASIQDYTLELQRYQSEVQAYQAEVNKDIQEYTQKLSQYQLELSISHQAWAKTESDNIQVFQSDIQNELNEFNKENARYQANVQAELAKHNSDLQKALTQAQLDVADAQQEAAQTTDIDKFNKAQDQVLNLTNAAKQIEDVIADNDSKIQKYSAELNQYQQDMGKEVQDFVNTLQKESQEYQSKVALYNSELQKYQAELGEESAKVGSATQNAAHYSAQADKYYQWAVAEVQMYVSNNSKMINQTMAAQAAQQRR